MFITGWLSRVSYHKVIILRVVIMWCLSQEWLSRSSYQGVIIDSYQIVILETFALLGGGGQITYSVTLGQSLPGR